MGDIDVELKELIALRDNLQRAAEGAEKQAFFESCAKELAERLYAKVVKRTPVGRYEDSYDLEDDGEKKFLVMSDKEGGTLKKGWTIGHIHREGDNYVIEVSNDVQYASYVEFGHRQTPGRYVPAIGKKLKKSWVPAKYMLTLSTKEIRDIAPLLLEKRLAAWLGEVFSNDK